MLEGLKSMALKSPDSDKKEMLLDVVKFGIEVSKDYQMHLNSLEYMQYEEDRLKMRINQLERELKETKIKLEKREKQINKMI